MLDVWVRLFESCEIRKQMARQMGFSALSYLTGFLYMPCLCYKYRFLPRKSKHKQELSLCPGTDGLSNIQKQQELVITSSLAECFRALLCHVPDVNSINPLWGQNAIWTLGLQLTAQKDESHTDYLLSVTVPSAIRPWRMGFGGLREQFQLPHSLYSLHLISH